LDLKKKMEAIKYPNVAGVFYPSEKEKLKLMLDSFISQNHEIQSFDGKIIGCISPHAGYIYSGTVAGKVYSHLKNFDQSKFWKVLIVAPSHYFGFSGLVFPNFKIYRTPLGDVKVGYLPAQITEIQLSIFESNQPFEEEHAMEVQIPFLQRVLSNFEVYPVLAGNVSFRLVSELIQEFSKVENSFFVISSDLSHYLPYNEAIETDSETIKNIESLITDSSDRIDACGKIGILGAMDAAKKLSWKIKLVDYKNSGDTAGDKKRVVGYGSFLVIKEL